MPLAEENLHIAVLLLRLNFGFTEGLRRSYHFRTLYNVVKQAWGLARSVVCSRTTNRNVPVIVNNSFISL
jgi:hypothetical protein